MGDPGEWAGLHPGLKADSDGAGENAGEKLPSIPPPGVHGAW